MVKRTAEVFQAAVPDRFAAQMEAANKTPEEYVIGGTPFTTLTVNRNIAGRIHKDKGDYAPGFGAMCCLRAGTYGGGWLVFPEYRVAADLGDGDLVMFDPHSFHAVTDFENPSDDYERITVVHYFREKMVDCLPLKEELERARARGELK